MKKPLKVQGYHFNYEDGIKARDENKLLICGLETNYKCNLKCSYCAWGSGPQEEKTIDIKKLKVFLDNIKKKGGKSAVIVGGGEPTLYSDFKELVKYISDIGMQPILITNGIAINDELAEFLNDKNCSIFLKADSFNEEVQDKLSGVSGMFKKNHEALLRLMKLGFNTVNSNNETRLAMSIVVNKQNINEVPDIWRFCRDNDIYPNLEILNLSSGRALENKEMLEVTEEQLNHMFSVINKIDEEIYGKIEKHNSTSKCARHLYNLYLNVDGYVQPCSMIRIKTHNIDNLTFDEIYNSEFYTKVRSNINCLSDNSAKSVYSSDGE